MGHGRFITYIYIFMEENIRPFLHSLFITLFELQRWCIYGSELGITVRPDFQSILLHTIYKVGSCQIQMILSLITKPVLLFETFHHFYNEYTYAYFIENHC